VFIKTQRKEGIKEVDKKSKYLFSKTTEHRDLEMFFEYKGKQYSIIRGMLYTPEYLQHKIEQDKIDTIIEKQEKQKNLKFNENDKAEKQFATDVCKKFMIELNQIEDAKDWTEEQITSFIGGLYAESTGEVSDTVESVETVTTDSPVTEETVSTTPEPTVSETQAEPEKSDTTAVDDCFSNITKAKDRTSFESAIRDAFELHKENKGVISMLYEAIVSKDMQGKYTRKIAKQPKEQTYKTINNVINPKQNN
jgi:hypothetical protein